MSFIFMMVWPVKFKYDFEYQIFDYTYLILVILFKKYYNTVKKIKVHKVMKLT